MNNKLTIFDDSFSILIISLREKNIKAYENRNNKENELNIEFNNYGNRICFSNNRAYAWYDFTLKDDGLIERLSYITRVEKNIDGQFYPIWTKEDGEFENTVNFVKLNGRYYSIVFLEQLLNIIAKVKT